MRKITFDTFEDAIRVVEDFSDGLGCNVSITVEGDGTYVPGHRNNRSWDATLKTGRDRSAY